MLSPVLKYIKFQFVKIFLYNDSISVASEMVEKLNFLVISLYSASISIYLSVFKTHWLTRANNKLKFNFMAVFEVVDSELQLPNSPKSVLKVSSCFLLQTRLLFYHDGHN